MYNCSVGVVKATKRGEEDEIGITKVRHLIWYSYYWIIT